MEDLMNESSNPVFAQSLPNTALLGLQKKSSD